MHDLHLRTAADVHNIGCPMEILPGSSLSPAAQSDRAWLWHPFTQMRDWLSAEPVVIARGEGAVLWDENGNEFIDGNSSIWTNLHGHRCSEIDEALREQLSKIAHSSFLGLSNDAAPKAAEKLMEAFDPEKRGAWRVFYSDDGSTAIEAGIKMIHQARVQRGESHRNVFVSLSAGYHGDTIGAMSVGHSQIFHAAYKPLLFAAREVTQPGCYRCSFNQSKPVRGADARSNPRCKKECVGEVERVFDELGETVSAFILEPRVQGAGSMAMHPPGYLAEIAKMCRERGIWLMLDEVLTGFGRTGETFAFHKEEGVLPDLVAVAKGFTGGYLPMAATIVSEEIFSAFLGDYSEFKTFFHGHSYCGNQLGAAAAVASLNVLDRRHDLSHRKMLAAKLSAAVSRFWEHPNVGDVRCEGTICAIELVEDFETRRPFELTRRIGFRVSEGARKYGLLTRPIGDVILLMPPYCITDQQIERAVDALWHSLCEVLPLGIGAGN